MSKNTPELTKKILVGKPFKMEICKHIKTDKNKNPKAVYKDVLGQRLGLSGQTISNIVNGQQRVSLKTLLSLSAYSACEAEEGTEGYQYCHYREEKSLESSILVEPKKPLTTAAIFKEALSHYPMTELLSPSVVKWAEQHPGEWRLIKSQVKEETEEAVPSNEAPSLDELMAAGSAPGGPVSLVGIAAGGKSTVSASYSIPGSKCRLVDALEDRKDFNAYLFLRHMVPGAYIPRGEYVIKADYLDLTELRTFRKGCEIWLEAVQALVGTWDGKA